jgi:hypothetical protein
MRKYYVSIALATAIAATSLWLTAQETDSRPIPALMPPGALIYLEAKDFGGLLKHWNGSNEKRRWLASTNFRMVGMSRLVGRLSQAQDEFADVAGIPVAMNLVDQVAGGRSGFAFYDLAKLSFVYVTQIPQSRLKTTALWRSRASYKTREVAGIPFYVKSNAGGQRTVAFTSYKEWLVVSTNEERMAETLVLLSGTKTASLSTEPWLVQAEKQSQEQGDLRLVYNLRALLTTPQFRTYWIHRNASELKPFKAGISDLFQNQNGFEERRSLLRNEVTAERPADSALTQGLTEALAYAPAGATLYRAWSMPVAGAVTEAVQQVVSGERPSAEAFNAPAPEVTPEAGAVGNEGDLEVRIDEPPFQRAAVNPSAGLADAISAMQPVALLHAQSTAIIRDRVFVLPNSALVVICRKPDQSLLDKAMAQISGLQTGTLDPLRVSISGQAVILARMDLPRSANPPSIARDVVYTAVYDHAVEWPRYKKLFQVIDTHAASPEMQVSNSVPPFFSNNLRSLGDTLAGLRSASIVTADSGGEVVHETVRYEMGK